MNTQPLEQKVKDGIAWVEPSGYVYVAQGFCWWVHVPQPPLGYKWTSEAMAVLNEAARKAGRV